jgi:chromate reductase
MENKEIVIAGICGSLRKASYNRQLLNVAIKIAATDGIRILPVEIAQLPLYNADIDIPEVKTRPAAVEEFRTSIANTHGLLIVSPEYNYSIPGPLKNAFDWASRGKDSPLKNKPVALVGASTSFVGSARMQVHFLSLFLYMDMQPVYQPEVLISKAEEKFNKEGELIDDTAMQLLHKKLAALKLLITNQRILTEFSYK